MTRNHIAFDAVFALLHRFAGKHAPWWGAQPCSVQRHNSMICFGEFPQEACQRDQIPNSCDAPDAGAHCR